MISNPGENVLFLLITVVLTFTVLCFSLQGGLERITKFMMTALLVLMLAILAHAITLPGAKEGM